MTRATIILGELLVALTAADAAVRPKETVRTWNGRSVANGRVAPARGPGCFGPTGRSS